MAKSVEHAVAGALDQALIHTVCTACRMRLHRLRMLLEQAESIDVALERGDRVYEISVRVSRALHRLASDVHVCQQDDIVTG